MERFSESKIRDLLDAAHIRDFDHRDLPQFAKKLNAGAGRYCESERFRFEHSKGKLKEDRERWTTFLRRLQTRCRELAEDIGNAEDDLAEKLEVSLPGTIEVGMLDNYATTGADGYRWLHDFKHIKSIAAADIDDLWELVLSIATLGRLAEHLLSERPPGKAGAPSIDHLDALVIGIAVGYQGLTKRPFTHQKFAAGKNGREPVTPGGRLVRLALDELAETEGITIRASRVETACARAVKELRQMTKHRRVHVGRHGKLD